MKNAKAIKQGLKDAGYTVFGGVNAPYIWLKTPGEMTSGNSLTICSHVPTWLEHLVPDSDRVVRDISG